MHCDIWNISNKIYKCETKTKNPYVSLFETFESNQTFIFNHHQAIKQWNRRNIMWGIEINLQIFGDKMDKTILTNISFSQTLLDILL